MSPTALMTASLRSDSSARARTGCVHAPPALAGNTQRHIELHYATAVQSNACLVNYLVSSARPNSEGGDGAKREKSISNRALVRAAVAQIWEPARACQPWNGGLEEGGGRRFTEAEALCPSPLGPNTARTHQVSVAHPRNHRAPTVSCVRPQVALTKGLSVPGRGPPRAEPPEAQPHGMTERTDSGTPGSSIRPPGDHNPRPDPPLDFRDKDLDSMTPADYEAIGFMGGLEVHQQLLTRSKLFCRCPAGRRMTRYDAEVLRHMRPTLSELGEYDGTALMEFKTHKEIVYQLERNSVCTYEIDDTPPFEIDDEAIEVALEIAMLCNLNLVSELHVMRKQYLDGSIPTGFQRTAMVGLTGTVPFRVPSLGVDRELRIRQLSLEEDSCREIADVGHRIWFRTDRLGTPLSETVTEPDARTPLELQAAARLLARIARATGKVRRGPGAARQDVNVSVAGGRRVEIKGVDNHLRLPLLVHTEAFRQLNLLRVRAVLERRGVQAAELQIEGDGDPWNLSDLVADVTSLVGKASAAPIREAIARGDRIAAVRLPRFAGVLRHTTQPGTTFAHELADRVRVIACPVHRPFMAHSDQGESTSPLTSAEWRSVGAALQAGDDDALVVVWAPDRDVATAVHEIVIRAAEALVGVPAETRQSFRDGTTGFERILPGPDRMYPDTDTPPIPIPDRMVARIHDALPERPWERQRRYEALGLDRHLAARLAGVDWVELYDAAAPPAGEAARRLATALLKRLPYHRRRLGRDDVVTPDALRSLAGLVHDGSVLPEATDRAVDALVERPEDDPVTVLERFRRRAGDDEVVTQAVHAAVDHAAALDGRAPGTRLRYAMGEVMPRFLGRCSPQDVRAHLVEALGMGTEVGA